MADDTQLTGLGDVVAQVTSKLGIKPCKGCKKRQTALNKAVPFMRAETVGPARRRQMFEHELEHLHERTGARLRHLHVAVTAKGAYCLDFNQRFDTLEQLFDWIIAKLQTVASNEILPTAPVEMWRQYMDDTRFTLVRHYTLPPAVAKSSGAMRMTVLKGEFE